MKKDKSAKTIFTEKAEIPIPKTEYLISRNWTLKGSKKGKTKKDVLLGYDTTFLKEGFSPNLGLAFFKYSPDIHLKELSERKRVWFHEIIKNYHFDESKIPDDHLYKILKEKDKEKIKEQLKKRLSLNIEIIDATTDQPLIVGLGEASPYETGITLDFLTGLPIIPSSAIKGITKRAAIMLLSGKTDILPYGEEFRELAEKYENHEQLVEAFGTQDQKGKAIFMDAYPIDWPDEKLFHLDVMNPHYQPYYENPKKNPPADWYNPIPVFYITVNTNIKYRFILATKNSGLIEKIAKWLEFALTHIGVGAKGSQGYGVFAPTSEDLSTS